MSLFETILGGAAHHMTEVHNFMRLTPLMHSLFAYGGDPLIRLLQNGLIIASLFSQNMSMRSRFIAQHRSRIYYYTWPFPHTIEFRSTRRVYYICTLPKLSSFIELVESSSGAISAAQLAWMKSSNSSLTVFSFSLTLATPSCPTMCRDGGFS